MKKLAFVTISLFSCGCATKRASVTIPFPKPKTAQQKGFNEGYLAAERSYSAKLVENLKAKGFADADDAYKSCIETIIRVGQINTEYRGRLESLGK